MPPIAKPDQYRALGLGTFAFTVCFAVWTLFSIIGVQIKQDLGLSDTEFGLLVAGQAGEVSASWGGAVFFA